MTTHYYLINLQYYKCSDAALNLLASYRSNRQQVVDSGEGSSKSSFIKSGVPQGSILGTTFFLISLNTPPWIIYAQRMSPFPVTYRYRYRIVEMEPKLQHDGNISKTWTEQNKMQIHFDKTSYMTVGTRQSTRESPDLNIMIDNNKIKQVHNQNLLGAHLWFTGRSL